MKKKKINPEKSSLSKDEIEASLSITPTIKGSTYKRVSFYIFKRAGLTVEAALALPLFLMASVCIISIMGIYSKTLEKMVSLRNLSESSAYVASMTDSEIWLELPGIAELKPFFLPAGLGAIKVNCVGRARAWTGRSSWDNNADGSESEYVYVTETGTVYHTSPECTHIDLSIHQTTASKVDSMRNSDGGKYHACEKCAAGGQKTGVLYITDDGDKYHTSPECSGLTRTVKLMEKSEVEELPCCSRCGSKAQ